MAIRTLSDTLGLEQKTKRLVNNVTYTKSKDKSGKSQADRTDVLTARVDPEELEKAYLKCPVLRNSISKLTQLIMHPGYVLEGDDDVVNFFETFFDKIGRRGGERTWEDILEKTFKYQFIYGSQWLELIPAKGGKNIIDLDYIDPKKMDFAKEQSDRLALDEFGNPVGYTQEVPEGVTIDKGDTPPKEVTLQGSKIFFNPERIAHFKMDSVGNGFYGIGLVETVYQAAKYKLNIEQTATNAIERVGFGILKGETGDEHHEPVTDEVKHLSKEMQKATSDRVISLPNYQNIELIEPSKSSNWKDFLQYYIEQEVTGLGLPFSFATGLGKDANRAILERQEYLLKISLKQYIKRTLGTLHGKVFRRIANSNGFKKVPKIKWNEIATEEFDSKADRIAKYVSSNLVKSTDKLARYLEKSEDLPKNSFNAPKDSEE